MKPARWKQTSLSQFAIIGIAAVVAIVVVILVPGKSSAPNSSAPNSSAPGRTASHSEAVAKATFKGAWPFTVDHGTVLCSPPRSILFDTTNGYEYGLNAAARSDGYAPPDAIRSGRKVPLTDLVERGLKLCH
jgi:hypothetical protein